MNRIQSTEGRSPARGVFSPLGRSERPPRGSRGRFSGPRRAILASAIIGYTCLSGRAFAQECTTSICVGDPCTISGTHLLSDGCFLDFGTKRVTVAGSLQTNGLGGSFALNAGTLTISGSLEGLAGEIDIDVATDLTTEVVQGSAGRIKVNQGGSVFIVAGGTVALMGTEVNADGNTNGFGGDIIILAQNISMATGHQLHANGNTGGDGGNIILVADGDLTANGSVTADGNGSGASGGCIDLEAGVGGTLTISKVVEATATDAGLFDGDIQLGPACKVVITGTVRARNPKLASPGFGSTLIIGTGTIDLTQATLLADSNGSNEVDCRCVDTNNDEVCDAGCAVSPTGLGSASANPAIVLVPLPLPPCGCGNGVVESALGEQCDDANADNFDGCRYDCQLPRCGDGLVDPGEQCDDGSANGNTLAGDCCSLGCQVQPNGTGCTTAGNHCSTCEGGLCTSVVPVVCAASDQCHVAGSCTPASGCSNPTKPNGTACNDGNACTRSDTCQSGTCTGANPIVCTAQDQCHVAGTCSPSTGVCSNPPKANGTACNDGNACTQSDACQGGACVGSPVMDGTPCNDGNSCTGPDLCMAGTCRGTACLLGTPCGPLGSTMLCQGTPTGSCACQ